MTFSIDNERPDIQLAFDRSEGQKRENYANELRKNVGNRSYKKAEWGGENSMYLMSEIVCKAIESGKGGFYNKEDVCLDMSFDDAVEWAFIKLGLSSDKEPAPFLHFCNESQFEIKW